MEAVGIVEMFGFVCAIKAADAAAKAADVKIIAIDSNKPANAWGYGRDPQSLEEFYARLKGLVDVIMDNPYICAFCYTQLTDVFQEVNGMYTFERGKKFDTATVNAILTRVAAIEKLDQ